MGGTTCSRGKNLNDYYVNSLFFFNLFQDISSQFRQNVKCNAHIFPASFTKIRRRLHTCHGALLKIYNKTIFLTVLIFESRLWTSQKESNASPRQS